MFHNRRIFRFDTFGSEEFWGGKLRLLARQMVASGRACRRGLQAHSD